MGNPNCFMIIAVTFFSPRNRREELWVEHSSHELWAEENKSDSMRIYTVETGTPFKKCKSYKYLPYTLQCRSVDVTVNHCKSVFTWKMYLEQYLNVNNTVGLQWKVKSVKIAVLNVCWSSITADVFNNSERRIKVKKSQCSFDPHQLIIKVNWGLSKQVIIHFALTLQNTVFP